MDTAVAWLRLLREENMQAISSLSFVLLHARVTTGFGNFTIQPFSGLPGVGCDGVPGNLRGEYSTLEADRAESTPRSRLISLPLLTTTISSSLIASLHQSSKKPDQLNRALGKPKTFFLSSIL